MRDHFSPHRFVICASQRTGSHMLATALDQHTHLRVAGEIFWRPDRYGIEPDYTADGMLARAFEQYDGFILHRRSGLRYPLVAAKEHERTRLVWATISRNTELAIISLKRRDLLAMALSYIMAEKTGVWQVATDSCKTKVVDPRRDHWCAVGYKAHTQQSVRIKPAWLTSYFREVESQYSNWDSMLAAHPLLTCWYEELCSHPDDQLRAVQEFLALPVEPICPATIRQETRPLREAIENYEELKQRFATTEWARYFG